MLTTMFPAVKYKAIDYVYEASTRQKLTMNWLVLPVPYHLDSSDMYPHTGTLPEGRYRTPWTRGTVISTCKLIISASILDDLMNDGKEVDFNEKFSFSPGFLGGVSVEMVPSSNPASQSHLDLGEGFWLLDGSGKDTTCKETFIKVTEELLHPDKQPSILGVYMKEEMLFVDHLLRFGQQLPRLQAMLGRLKTLTVPDPLLLPAGDKLPDDFLFRRCLPFEEPRVADAGLGITEEFNHLPVLQDEVLILPLELVSCHPKNHRASPLRELQEFFKIVPEPIEKDPSCQDILRKDMPASLWVSVEIPDFKMAEAPTQNVPSGEQLVHYRLYPQLETDLTLTPPNRCPPHQAQLSCATLPAERMSPVYRHRLMSDCAREAMEEATWKAEKHLPVVLSLLLAEPQMANPTLQYQPVSEALKLIKSEGKSIGLLSEGQENTGDSNPKAGSPKITGSPAHSCSKIEIVTKNLSEFVEMVEDCGTTVPVAAFTEDFLPFSFSQIDHILRECCEDTSHKGCPDTPSPIKDIPASCFVTDTMGSSCQEMQKINKQVAIRGTATNQRVEPDQVGGSVRGERSFSVQEERGVPKSIPTTRSSKDPFRSCSVSRPEEDLDPLLNFMMLRSQQKARVATLHQNSSCREPNVALEPKEELKPRVNLKTSGVISAGGGSDVRTQETGSTTRPEAGVSSQVISVEASESQRRAYRQLHAAASPHLSSARELGLFASTSGDFSSLILDQTRFVLKQQEKEWSAGRMQGETSVKDIPLYKQVGLIHLLVTLRDLLLKCDVSTAVDYLKRATEMNMDACLGELWAKLRVVQYLSQRNKEPNPKIAELQRQMKAWMQKNRTRRPSPKALVITTFDDDRLRALLANSLSHSTGVPASAVCPGENCSKLDCWRVKECLQRCWCLVICGQHIGLDFPWQCFSLAVEFDQVNPSSWATVCRERSISHMRICTTIPCSEGDCMDQPLNQDIPFTLLVTESLLNSHLLLQSLESVYNMTVLERDYPHLLKMLGGTSHYFVMTVDESTAVVIQELEELALERSSERFVLRMTALSLQYSCCWVLFYCGHAQGSAYSFNSEVFNNLVLIYSSFVLFGLKSEDLDVKVLIVAEASHLARCIQQISHQTLMSSGRDPLAWLDRDWLSVLPTEEEKCLTLFPSVNPLVAQLMLRRAPSLQWLLRATLPELKELLPEVPHKVIKLFSDTTALYKLNVSHSPPNSLAMATQSGTNIPCSPWGIDVSDPRDNLCDISSGPEDLMPHGCDEDTLDMMEGAVDFTHCIGTTVSKATFARDSACNQLWADETTEVHFAGFSHSGREMGTGRTSLGKMPSWSIRDSHNPTTGNNLQYRPSLGNDKSPWQSDGQALTFSGGLTGQRPHYTPATNLALPTPAGTQWNGPTVVSPCEYRGEACAYPEPEGCLWSRSGQKRSAYTVEQAEWKADLPQLKKGKLTYEKVPGRSDGQTRLAFF